MLACSAYHQALAIWSVRVCWWGFLGVWVVAGLYNALRSPRVARRRFSTWRWLAPVIAWVILLRVPRTTWDHLVFCEAWLRDLGLVFLYVGTALTLWARFDLGIMWTGAPAQRTGHELRTTGAYAITRHPIYTGLLTMVLGTALACHVGMLGPLFVVVVLTLTAKLRIEEKLMLELFGMAYETYQRRVPALVPWPR